MQLIDLIIRYAEENVEPVPLSIQLIIVLIICAACAIAVLVRLFVNYRRNADEFEKWSDLRAYVKKIKTEMRTLISDIKYKFHATFYKIFKRTNRYCNRCGHPVYKSDVGHYLYVCFHCDINMYTFETFTK